MPVPRKKRTRPHGETPGGDVDGAVYVGNVTAAVAGGGSAAPVEDDKLREARLLPVFDAAGFGLMLCPGVGARLKLDIANALCTFFPPRFDIVGYPALSQQMASCVQLSCWCDPSSPTLLRSFVYCS